MLLLEELSAGLAFMISNTNHGPTILGHIEKGIILCTLVVDVNLYLSTNLTYVNPHWETLQEI